MSSASVAEEIKVVFRAEAIEILTEMAEIVEHLPDSAGDALYGAMRTFMRCGHNIKGAASVAGFEEVELLAHGLEGTMAPFAKAQAAPSEEALILMEAGVALARRLVGGEHLPEVVEETLREMEACRAAVSAATAGKAPAAGAAPGIRAAPAVSGQPAAPASSAAPPEGHERKESSIQASIRVDTARLDRLMGFAGELLVAGSQQEERSAAIEEFGQRLQQLLGEVDLARDPRFVALTEELDTWKRRDHQAQRSMAQLSGEIGAAMKRLRMLPLGDVAPVWRRILVDTAAKLGREVQVVFELGDIELDRYVIDSLRDPFMHFLRNAIDHGIGSPEARRAAGKPSVGKVLIRSTRHGAMVRLEISDDGLGLNPREIGAAALAKGLVDEAELARMSDADVLSMVFISGFSTAKQVSLISGRGVGLDVVKRRIEELGGAVHIGLPPTLGGATFVLLLPVSLLSAKGLLVRAGPSTFVLPSEMVLTTRRVPQADVRELGGAWVADVDGGSLRLGYLGALAATRGRPPTRARWLVVVLARGEERLGVIVDEILLEQEVVTKRLPWNLRRVAGVSGAVVLPSGAVAVAVDVAYLFEAAQSKAGGAAGGSSRARRLRLLVVDDSLTARAEMHKALAGDTYEVTVAGDGEEAWAHLARERYDLVISDIQMPRLDGLSLTRRIRASAKHRDLAVILVTSLASPDDVTEGAAAGANEYLVKGRYRADDLRSAVARLVSL